jgi:chromosome segregation ATPase
LNRPGEAATVGIIQVVLVENFMCHRKLRVDFCRNINFIHGQNGSGKSAILAALQICLGAGARRTHRARNLASLVRTDHVLQPTHAKLSVTIRNEGDDAFRYEEYGNKITVERTIALKPGSTYNGYKLLNAEGKEVSRSRRDLDDMLDHMNIQVENPVAILDQEEAKKFLTGKATDKYKFFMNACELERLDRAYATVLDNLQDVREAKERLADGIESERLKVQELKRQYEQHRELDKLQTKLMTDQCKMAWAMYNAHAQELQVAQDKRRDFETKAAQKREELSQVEQLTQESTTDHDNVEARMTELSNKAQEIGNEKKKLQEAYKQALQPLKAAESAVKQAERREKQARKDLVASEKRLQDALAEIAAQNDDDADWAAQLAQAEQQLADAREQDVQFKRDITESHHQYLEVEPLAEQARRDYQDIGRKYQAARDKLAEMQRSSGDSLAVFGPRVKKLRNEIERHKKEFKGPVLGPIGAYLKICPGKEAYAPLAELALGSGTLDRFIVTNNHDRKILQQLRSRVGCNRDCGIFLMSNDDVRFSIPSPPTGVETPATVLKIDNNLVRSGGITV